MSSYKQIFYHIIFSTKNRQPTLNEKYCEDLYKYIWGVIKKNKCTLYRINGIENHLHIFCDLHPSLSLSDLIKDIKVSSNLWLKGNGNFPDFDSWQKGYGAFTYSTKQKQTIINYIKKQKEHHKKEKFYDEFKRILNENDVDFDEKHLL